MSQSNGATYAEQVTRTYELHETWHANGHSYVEVTVTWHYPDAPDEARRMRFVKRLVPAHRGGRGAGIMGVDYYIHDLSGRPNMRIDGTVTVRLAPHLVDGALTSAWVKAFYGD